MNIDIAETKQVYLDGVDVSDYIANLTVEIPAFGMASASVLLTREILNVVIPNTGSIIEIWKGSNSSPMTRKFYGIVVAKSDDLSGFSLYCCDELWKASGQTIVKLYDTSDPMDMFGGDLRLILIDIVGRCGLTMDDSTVDATSIIIPQVHCDNVKGITKIEELINLLYWHVYQNPVDRKIYARNPANYTAYPTTFEVGTTVVDSPNYGDNIGQVVNEIEIQGVRAFVNVTDNFTGTGSQQSFQLSKYPIATFVAITVAGVAKVGAVEGSSGTYDYLVNLNMGSITFTVAPSAAAAVVANYTAVELTSVVVDSPASKVVTKGARKLVMTLNDASTVADAFARANAILEQTKNNFSNFTLGVLGATDLTPQYLINFKDALKNVSYTNLTIVKIKTSWPDPVDQVEVGKNTFILNNLLYSVEERVKKLERVRREGMLLRINKILDDKLYFMFDDLEIIEQSLLGIPDKLLVKRKYRWEHVDELALGTYDNNINIYNNAIEFI